MGKIGHKVVNFFSTSERIALALFICFPLGAYLVWKKSHWKLTVKIISTLIGFVFLILILSKMISSQQNLKLNNQLTEYKNKVELVELKNKQISKEHALLKDDYEELQVEGAIYKEKMKPYEDLSEADAKQKEAELKAAEEKRKKVEADKKAAQEKKEKEAEVEANRKAEEKRKEAEIKKAEEEARGYETGTTYDQLARTPDDYLMSKVKFYGKVIQVIEGEDHTNIRMAVNDDYDTILLGEYDSKMVSSRILEDDYITVSGISMGITSYKSTMGGNISIPSILIQKID